MDTPTDIFIPPPVPFLDFDNGHLALTPWAPVAFPPALCLDPANLRDFVQWGVMPGSPVTTAAVAAFFWSTVLHTVDAPGLGETIAWDGTANGPATWFHDVTPTLGSANVSHTADSAPVFPPCSPAALAPFLTAFSVPALGNRDFALNVFAAAPSGDVLLFVGLGANGTPLANGCIFHVDQILLTMRFTADIIGGLEIPVPVPELPALLGQELSFQAAALPKTGGTGFPFLQLTNGLVITF